MGPTWNKWIIVRRIYPAVGSSSLFVKSRPKFSCGFANNSEFNAFFANSFFTDGFEVRGNFTDPQVIKQFLATAPVADKLMRSLGEKCAQTNAEFLPFMGTVIHFFLTQYIWL